jgi:hypothetical protein
LNRGVLPESGTPGGSNMKDEVELKKMPQVEFSVQKSRDGKYLIHKTTITDIKPFAYYKAVLEA